MLFQADIEAITQALDTFPSQGDATNENSSAQPLSVGDGLSPRRGISPLRLSTVLKQRTPGREMGKMVLTDCDVEDLRLQLAVAVRQAEHFRRENAALQERNARLQVCTCYFLTPHLLLIRSRSQGAVSPIVAAAMSLTAFLPFCDACHIESWLSQHRFQPLIFLSPGRCQMLCQVFLMKSG